MGITESTVLDEKYFGFRVYKLVQGGPLQSAGLKELEDFIIPPKEVFESKMPFYEFIKLNQNMPLNLQIYSLTRHIFYDITITPNLEWNAEGKAEGYLGAGVRYENWKTASTNVLRVVKVKSNQPAHLILNLIPNEDFIIALRPTGKDIFSLNKDHSDPLTLFTECIKEWVGSEVEFYIYNIKNGARHVKINLESNNGEILGCDVAYGKLHEFPRIIPNNLRLFDDNESGNNYSPGTTFGSKISNEKKEDDIVIVDENKN
jgi:hypothetical protein